MDLGALNTCPVQQQLLMSQVGSGAAAASVTGGLGGGNPTPSVDVSAAEQLSKCSLLNSFTSPQSVNSTLPNPHSMGHQAASVVSQNNSQNAHDSFVHYMNSSIESNAAVKSSKSILQRQDQHLASLPNINVNSVGALTHSQHAQHVANRLPSTGSLECPQNPVSALNDLSSQNQHSLHHATQQTSPGSVNNVANDLMTQQLLRAAAAGCFGTQNNSCPNSAITQNQTDFNPMANLMAAVSTATAAVGDHSGMNTSTCPASNPGHLSTPTGRSAGAAVAGSCSPSWDALRGQQAQTQNGVLLSPQGANGTCPLNPRPVRLTHITCKNNHFSIC